MNKKIILGLYVLSMSNAIIFASFAMLSKDTASSGTYHSSTKSTTTFTSLTSLSSDQAAQQQEFFDAIQGGNLGLVKSLLVKKASLSDTNASGSTPLHFAVLFSHSDIVQFLIKVGTIVNAHNTIRDGNTPLHDAVDQGNIDIVKLLLKGKADVNLKNHDNNTPREEAQKKGLTAMVSLLEMAAQSQKTSLLLDDEKELIKSNKKAGNEIIPSIENAQENKRTESISSKKDEINAIDKNYKAETEQKAAKLLLGASIQSQKTSTPPNTENAKENKRAESISPKKDAINAIAAQAQENNENKGSARKGDTSAITMLLESSTKKVLSKKKQRQKQRKYDKKLLEAARWGKREEVERLLKAGANLNARDKEYGDTPLHEAAYNSKEGTVKILIEKGANFEAVDKGGFTPLHVAAGVGHEGTVDLLIKKGANLEAIAENGWRPLHWAARNGKGKVVKLLIEKKAALMARAADGWTPLHEAVYHGHEDTVKILIEKGSNLKAVDNNGYTPLHVAARRGHEKTVKTLIENEANLEAIAENGWRPLHEAALNGKEEVVKLLIEKNANSEARDNKGRTPRQLTNEGHKKICEMLAKASA